jgi:hypothetical protein
MFVVDAEMVLKQQQQQQQEEAELEVQKLPECQSEAKFEAAQQPSEQHVSDAKPLQTDEEAACAQKLSQQHEKASRLLCEEEVFQRHEEADGSGNQDEEALQPRDRELADVEGVGGEAEDGLRSNQATNMKHGLA